MTRSQDAELRNVKVALKSMRNWTASKEVLTFCGAGSDAARSLILHLAEILNQVPCPDTRIFTPTFSYHHHHLLRTASS